MNVTGIPAPLAAGQTVCITVTGASGPPTARGSPGISIISTTQTGVDPGTWVICFTAKKGYGVVRVEDGATTKSVAVVAI